MTHLAPRVLVIDNYDSFTWNLVQALWVLGAEVIVKLNDEISVDASEAMAPTHLLISPGPGRPEEAGVSIALLEAWLERIPVLGVCLGHQCLGLIFGAGAVSARSLVHGKASEIHHDGQTIFTGLPQPFLAARYHSLAVPSAALPEELIVSAHTADGEIMGLRHRSLPVEGVQFHPESILTPDGPQLLNNFLKLRPAVPVR